MSDTSKVDMLINFRGRSDDIEKTVKQIQNEISKIQLPQLQTKSIENAFDKVVSKINKYNEALDDTSSKNLDKQVRAAEDLESAYQTLLRTISQTTDLDISDLLQGFDSKRVKDINNIASAIQNEVEKEKELKRAQQDRIKTLEKINAAEQEREALKSKQLYTKKVTKGNLNNKEIEKQNIDAELAKKQTSEEYNKALQYSQRYDINGSSKKAQEYREIINNVEELKTKSEELGKILEQMNNRFRFDELGQQINNLNEDLSGPDGINNYIQSLKDAKTPIKDFKEEIKELGITVVNGVNVDDLKNYQQLLDLLESASRGETDEFINKIKTLKTSLEEGRQKTEENTEALKEYTDQEKTASSQTQKLQNDVEQFTKRLTRFFSLYYLGDQFVRAIRNAYSSIKELDKAMTETAVVTDFSVGDMWNKLPEYTEQANKLGVATVQAYDAATLYYQQGLDTNTVTQLTTSTLKMARIASLDAATATDRMTNALRGFNMELNETSAERVADVYSELAAVSATDVNELSVAMTKTASIANSANMEFENTAAFLAQMLETTRESAETAGTALKTVIGRFTEVKELYSTKQLSGTDENGDVIDVNKVSTALRTAGIDMNEFFTGAKGLDDIFMELAEKWDTLSIVQQRYIATQAAGSRQQSRFIAMLGDYDRLLELQADAYGANGASQEQYEKTMDSLETKLQKLQNAWNQFTMTLMNSDFVKSAISFITWVLNKLNDLIASISGGNGVVAALEALAITIGVIGAAIKANFSLGLEGKLNQAITNVLLKGIKQSEGPAAFASYRAGYVSGASYAEGYDDGKKQKESKVLEDFTNKNITANESKTTKLLNAKASAFLGIAAAIGIVVAAYKILQYHDNNFSSTGKYENAKKQVDLLATAYDNADKECQELLDTIDRYTEASNKTETLVSGTAEFTKALIEANNQAEELITKYNLVAEQDWIVNKDGRIVIDSGAQNRITQESQQKVMDAQAAKTLAVANEYDQKTQAAIEQFSKNIISSSENVVNTEKVLAAMAVGAGSGFVAGGAIGAAGAGVGAIPGAIAGGIAGGFAGVIDLMKNGTSTKEEKEAINSIAEAVNESSETMLAFSTALDKYENTGDNSTLVGVMNELGIVDEKMIDSLLSDTESLQGLISAVKANTEALKAQQKLAFEEKYSDRLSQDDIVNSSYITEKYSQFIEKSGEAFTNKINEIEGWSNNDLYETYLKTILNDQTAEGANGEEYRIRNRGGENVTVQQYIDGEWTDLSGKKNNLSKTAMRNEIAQSQLLNEASDYIGQWNDEAKKIDDSLKIAGIKGKNDKEDEKTYQSKRNQIATSIARGDTADLSSLTREEVQQLNNNLKNVSDTETRKKLSAGINEYGEIRTAKNIQSSSNWGQNYETMMAERKQTALNDAGMTEEDFSAFAQGLSDSLDIAEEKAEKLALREIELTNASEALKSIFEDEDDALKQGEKAGAAYYSALRKIQAQTKGLVGTELSQEWLEQAGNLEKVKKAANGDTEALKELQIEAAKEIVVAMDLDEESATELNNFIDQVEAQDISVGASLDDTDFVNTLNQMIASGQVTADQVNDYLSSMGYSPDIEMVDVESPTKFSANLEILGTPVTSVSGSVMNTIKVPQINASGTTYAGPTRTKTPSSSKNSKKSSGGGGSSDKKWKNELDPLYNTEQDLTEELRKQEIIKEELKHLDEDANASGQQKLDNLKKQLGNLQAQKKLQQTLLSGRSAQMDQTIAENSKYGAYAGYNRKDHTVEIDWTKINNDVASGKLDEDQYKELTDYISKLEELEKQMDDAQDALENIDDQIADILDYYHDEYVEFENRILDAIIELKQQEINNISDVNDAINEANGDLIDGINGALDKQRQERDNQEQEQNLTDLEQRIAYLSMDTSGANQLEILNLQKQLDDARQSYTDTLIDQKVNELKEQNDKANEQRMAQIELMQAQLDYAQSNGLLWEEVNRLIASGMDSQGNLKIASDLYTVISKAENWKALSSQQQVDMDKELKSLGSSAWTYLQDLKTFESGGYISTTLANIASKVGTGASGSTGNGSNGGKSTGYSPTAVNNIGTAEATKTSSSSYPAFETPRSTKKETCRRMSYTSAEPGIKIGSSMKDNGYFFNVYGGTTGTHMRYTRFGKSFSQYSRGNINSNGIVQDRYKGSDGYVYLKITGSWYRQGDFYKKYAQGGVADFTGPAWLDGTKSKPEYVLNSTQTAGFLKLVDVLDGFRNGNYNSSTNSTQTYGDFNVNIQVDQLANDYDTDKLVKRIKKEMYNDSTYRNFNNVTRLR